MNSCDVDFSRAVRSAAKALHGAELRKAANPKEGETPDPDKHATIDLIRRLRSPDFSCGPGECEMLADLLSGELCTTGRPPHKAEDRKGYQQLLVEAKALAKTLGKVGRNYAESLVEAAETLQTDKRAGNRAVSTIVRDMQDKM